MDIAMHEWVVYAILAIIGYLAKNKIETMETELKQIKLDMEDFKMNYLDRFEKVNKTISDSKIEIIKALSDLEIKISKHDGRK